MPGLRDHGFIRFQIAKSGIAGEGEGFFPGDPAPPAAHRDSWPSWRKCFRPDRMPSGCQQIDIKNDQARRFMRSAMRCSAMRCGFSRRKTASAPPAEGSDSSSRSGGNRRRSSSSKRASDSIALLEHKIRQSRRQVQAILQLGEIGRSEGHGGRGIEQDIAFRLSLPENA